MAEKTLVASTGFLLFDTKRGSSHPIFDGMVIGRREGDVVFGEDPLLSGRHLKILLRAGVVEVEDLKSTNKTKVNGKVLSPFRPLEIRIGDEIEAGDQKLVLKEAAAESSVFRDHEPTLNSMAIELPSKIDSPEPATGTFNYEVDPEPTTIHRPEVARRTEPELHTQPEPRPPAPVARLMMPEKPILPSAQKPPAATPEPISVMPTRTDIQQEAPAEEPFSDFPEIEVTLPEEDPFRAHLKGFVRLKGWHLSTYALLILSALATFAYRAQNLAGPDGQGASMTAIGIAAGVFVVLTFPLLLLNNYLYLHELKSRVTRALGVFLVASCLVVLTLASDRWNPWLSPSISASSAITAEAMAPATDSAPQPQTPAPASVSMSGDPSAAVASADLEREYNIAVAHYHLGRFDQALEELSRIARIDHGYKNTMELIASIQSRKQAFRAMPRAVSRPRRR